MAGRFLLAFAVLAPLACLFSFSVLQTHHRHSLIYLKDLFYETFILAKSFAGCQQTFINSLGTF
uniref:Uncharacterized protein n=1 Tax=Arundo donax TaxID=35708 RepID=A0A0A9HJZ0_ARUDO